MSRVFTTVALLAGCGEPPTEPEDVAEPGTVPEDVSPWDYTAEGTELPDVDPDGLSRALDQAIAEVLVEDARPVVAGYLDRYATSATAACPPITDDGLGNRYWATGCAAPDGTYFGGYLSHYTFDGTFDAESGLYLTGTQLGGNITIDGPGGILDLEGSATFVTGISGDRTTELVVSSLIGGFYAPSPGSWLGEARSVTNTLTGYTIPSIGGVVVVVDGSVVVLVDGEPYSVVFHGAQVANAAIGSDCDREPGGTVDIRDPYGRWVEVVFHGPTVEVTGGDPARCDGCGDATLDGAPIDPVCADFEPWFRWELLP